ncbi:hypothetical protein IWX49DRAFT_321550 [Phyllosticta citricarpa]|uniref:Uncharacterized protein n=2 Tax=Phyllosticta TaxID=121621 RepID=A0ABR1LHB7_9PEZI
MALFESQSDLYRTLSHYFPSAVFSPAAEMVLFERFNRAYILDLLHSVESCHQAGRSPVGQHYQPTALLHHGWKMHLSVDLGRAPQPMPPVGPICRAVEMVSCPHRHEVGTSTGFSRPIGPDQKNRRAWLGCPSKRQPPRIGGPLANARCSQRHTSNQKLPAALREQPFSPSATTPLWRLSNFTFSIHGPTASPNVQENSTPALFGHRMMDP